MPLFKSFPKVLPWLLLYYSVVTAAVTSQFERLNANAKLCPATCGPDNPPAHWFHYHSLLRLAVCHEPLLLDFNLYSPIGDPNAHTTVRACTSGNPESKVNHLAEIGYVDPDVPKDAASAALLRRGEEDAFATCVSPSTSSKRIAHSVSWEAEKSFLNNSSISDLAESVETLKKAVGQGEIFCQKAILFAYFRGTLIGLYSGAQVDRQNTAGLLLDHLLDEYKKSDGTRSRKALEICDQNSTSATILGVVADTSGDFGAVQAIMRSWNEANCANTGDDARKILDVPVWTFPYPKITKEYDADKARLLALRQACQYIRVDNGDNCESLAKRCGVGRETFENFNPDASGTCSKLKSGSPVCCTPGALPELRAQVAANGVCESYEVQTGEGCDYIARSHGISVDELKGFNKKTWGWDGCATIPDGLRICVSKGDPPLPASVWNADCGPTVPGTKEPESGQELADLNPCPLDVCCNVWGKCGTTKDFCIVSETESGNPGTSKPGENGCVANCGMDIVRNDKGPDVYRKIGYFEGWNYNRDCLNMHVSDIDESAYTHVHFSFGEISDSLEVVIPDDSLKQWKYFLNMKFGPKKILAFGGWEFSNAPKTSGRFRKAVQPENREAFAGRVAAFIEKNNVDGVDFDWEYPGATDIDGSDPGNEEDGENYLEFLKLVRTKLPQGKSLSIATASSYWYLKGFPIRDIAPVVDYIVYMTYDLHGQWDVGNDWAMIGCPAGNCLRSHVDAEETHQALVMITKAGVESHKVAIGVSSYGRSFKMADANCRTSPQCTFLGGKNQSPAAKGVCTQERGYLANYEINQIIKDTIGIKTWYNKVTDSDYLVYGGDEWVAYMTDETKSRRSEHYKGLNFGGTTDWAIDLQKEGTRRDDDDEDDKKCSEKDKLQSDEQMPLGRILGIGTDGTMLPGIVPIQFITIVNLTPYKFVKTYQHGCQFTVLDFGDIPSGKARQNQATYKVASVGSFPDTRAEIYYDIEGTNKKFIIRVTQRFEITEKYQRRLVFDLGGMGLGWRELGFPGEGYSAPIIIAGSEDFGYFDSLQLNNIGWMKGMYEVIEDRELRHVIMPGSHDAAMSIISDYSGWWGGGIAPNTANQNLDFYNQLKVGTRYFDMRIVSVDGGGFWGVHINDENAKVVVGATGESLDDMIAGINRFTSDYPGEVIIWWVRYLVDVRQGLPTGQWNTAKAEEFYTKLEKINNRCIGFTDDPPFDRKPMKEFMDANGGKGCVIIITDGTVPDDVPKEKISAGLYGRKYLFRDDFWAQEDTTQKNSVQQVSHMTAKTRNGEIPGKDVGKSDNFFIMQWQCSPNTAELTGAPLTLRLIANQQTNPAFYHYALNAMAPEYFPTVIFHDSVGTYYVNGLDEKDYNPAMLTLVRGLNLYMVTQNCKVSTVKHPFLVKNNAQVSTLNDFETFRGVIFANGTVLDTPPWGFCRHCSYNDTTAIDIVPGRRGSNSIIFEGDECEKEILFM